MTKCFVTEKIEIQLLPEFFLNFVRKSEVQKMEMKKENKYETAGFFYTDVRKAENEEGKRK